MHNAVNRDLHLRQVTIRSKTQLAFGRARPVHVSFVKHNQRGGRDSSIHLKDASSLTKITALAATLVLSFATHSALAQESREPVEPLERERRVEVVAFGGVGFTGDIGVSTDTQSGSVSFDGAPVYGALLGFRAQRNGYVYLSYSRMVTTAYYRPSGGLESSAQTDVSFDYLQVGGNLEAPQGRIVPYLGVSIGATRLAPVNGSGNDFSFSAVLDGGVKLMLAPFLDVRLIGRMPVSFVNGEAAALCVGGLGCAVHYSGHPLLQGQALLGVGLHL